MGPRAQDVYALWWGVGPPRSTQRAGPAQKAAGRQPFQAGFSLPPADSTCGVGEDTGGAGSRDYVGPILGPFKHTLRA